MDEEQSDHELEGRMYAMIHHVDHSLANVPQTNDVDGKIPVHVDITARTTNTVRRYWHSDTDQNTSYRKNNATSLNNANNTDKNNQKSIENSQPKTKSQDVNQPKSGTTQSKSSMIPSNQNISVTKEEKNNLPTSDLSMFQHPVPNNLTKTIEILENDDCKPVELQSSDEDEVIEIELPPKPTITIESSDEDDVKVSFESPQKENRPNNLSEKVVTDRGVSASPVPSIVSSVSDEFIRSDCIALNISSRNANNQSFDFSLHGSDLLDQTPSKKKKRKRNKDSATSTPIADQSTITPNKNSLESCFATPKSKAKKKKKSKGDKQSSKIIPMADLCDSDSNQSNQNSYLVTEKSLPSIDVYESDSNQSEQNETGKPNQKILHKEIDTSDSSAAKKSDESCTLSIPTYDSVIDLTEAEPVINESIVMANVMGFPDNDTIDVIDDHNKLGSTKIPSILCEDLDFDNLKGKNNVNKHHRFSLTTLRQEMEKFYNESWGGENFNHREIQKNMSRDKSLWVIDPKDRMPAMGKRKTTCNYCNRVGHRDDTCRLRPPVCYMCGSAGHYETRCPRKICVNCGSPNHVYSNMCRNCSNWNYVKCCECGQVGHPASHCPDFWRRYHNTIDSNMPLEENHFNKKHYQMYCSGCTRRGHLVHMCRVSLPFSGLPINTPYVHNYRPVYPPTASENIDPNKQSDDSTQQNNLSSTPRTERQKRQSKSPVVHDSHLNKKRKNSFAESNEATRCTKSPLNKSLKNNKDQIQKTHENDIETTNQTEEEKLTVSAGTDHDKAPDFIPIFSANHDKRGQVIQDNEVSDTSEVITSSRIYLAKDVKEALTTDDGKMWLEEAAVRNNITVENNSDDNLFISVKGTVGNQEAFQSELKEWRDVNNKKEKNQSLFDTPTNKQPDLCNGIPKNRNELLRKLTKALDSLKNDIGDPNFLYKELLYHQKKHKDILKMKVISTKQLANNRININGMLRRLNMILLGQAGLADGAEHLHELHLLQDKLTNLRNKNVSKTMRDEIGEHFHCIFTAIPRNDYADLLNKYYISKYGSTMYTKQNDPVKMSPKLKNKSVNLKRKFRLDVTAEVNSNCKPLKVQKELKKLDSFRQRLLQTKTSDAALRKKRLMLMKKLIGCMSVLDQCNHLPPKIKKRIIKIQDQAQTFFILSKL
ncbi:uncharacterized protein LOC126968666 [Leptidea sinapis]|uniref:Zinc finger CCHC domain-containing protein 7 n=1 Tax=Leptidea sinapis TaxID=189913 RepID=A0A5E4R526_9NEOP|nr:uncharacterized protein LOC126968666 [Leptidea sinapis]VVD05730.1 unnamed protein product [Leptidea sinapis]